MRFINLQPILKSQTLSRPFISPLRRYVPPPTFVMRRTLIPAPKANSGPLMEYRSDRELPDVPSIFRIWRSLPLFIAILVAASFGIFNYQKLNSSIVTSSLYALRTHEVAREILGDEIYFAYKVPWIWGTINQLHGKINIQFWVKGTKGKALMKFKSERKRRMGFVCSLILKLCAMILQIEYMMRFL